MVTFEKEVHIEAPFRDYNNSGWTDVEVAAYNLHTDAVNCTAGVEIEQGSLLWEERDTALNQRHALYAAVVISKKEDKP